MPPNARPQARNWCFTINNCTDEDAAAVVSLAPLCHYGVFQQETGANGTPHYQGYLAFKNRIRMATIRRTLPRAHLEIARGSPDDNRSYCTKPDTRSGPILEFGDFEEIPRKGERSDLAELQTAFDAGLTTDQYATDYFSLFVRYPKALDAYKQAKTRPRRSSRQCHVTLIRGDSGTGKSDYAETEANRLGGGVYGHSLGQFWDGYGGERNVIFEDFRGSSLPYGDFKRVCDRYPLRVGIKGSSCQMAATNFFITSNFDPENWWGKEVTGPDLTPIFRRITEVIYFSEFRKYHKFPNYRSYAIAVLTPVPDNGIRTLPETFEVPYDPTKAPGYIPPDSQEILQE